MKRFLLASAFLVGLVASALAQNASISAPVIINGVTPDIGGTPGYCLYVDAGGHANAQVCTTASSVNVLSGGSYLYNSLPIADAQTALNNYFFGGAGNLTMTGGANTASGYQALVSNTTGGSNTANGYGALYYNTTGGANTASGYDALFLNTTGSSNTANGYGALLYNTTGGSNTANGYGALLSNTTGSSNTASGADALFDYNDTTAANDNNSAFGYNTGRGLVTGINNTILGANVTGLSSALSNSIILATGDGTIRADFGKTAASVWTIAFLAGAGSRPVCVTSAGTLEAGSLSVGLTTCP